MSMCNHKSSLGCGKVHRMSVAWLSLSHSTESSKPQRGKLYCELIPEPVCGLSCAKASLPHANLSPISLSNSRQVCTLHILYIKKNTPRIHSQKNKKNYRQKFQVLILNHQYLMAYFDKAAVRRKILNAYLPLVPNP